MSMLRLFKPRDRSDDDRMIRLPASVWRPALAAAEQRGEQLPDVVRRMLVVYAAFDPNA